MHRRSGRRPWVTLESSSSPPKKKSFWAMEVYIALACLGCLQDTAWPDSSVVCVPGTTSPHQSSPHGCEEAWREQINRQPSEQGRDISAVNESTLASTQLLRHFTLWAGRDYRSEEQANISFLLCKIRHMKAEHLSELPKLEFTFSFRKLKCFWL